MTDTTIAVKDGTGAQKALAAQDGGSAGLIPYNAESTAQRATLLAQLALTAQDGNLTVTKNAIVSALQTQTASTQPVSASSLPLPAGAATDAKVEAVRALLASALSAIETDSAGAPRQLAGVNVVGGPLTAASDGTTNASTGIGPVARVRGDFNLTVICSTDFQGNWCVERRFTGLSDTSWHPLTALGTIVTFYASASEIFSEPAPGVDYRLRVLSLTAGSITAHRFCQ